MLRRSGGVSAALYEQAYCRPLGAMITKFSRRRHSMETQADILENTFCPRKTHAAASDAAEYE